MTLRTPLLVIVSALALAFVACESDPTPTPATDTGATDTGATDTGAADTATCSTTNVVGACMNECDLALSRAAVTSAATDCGLGCLSGDPAAEAECSNTCLIAASVDIPPAGQAISEGCSGCYVATIACTISNCIPACLDAASEACQTCQVEKGCISAFYACTGYELVCDNTTDDNGDGTVDCDDPSCAESSACAPTP
jgi:hypothetical protein